MLVVDDAIRRMIHDREDSAAIVAAASDNGMRSLRADGLCKIKAGVTTIDEVVRVTMRSAVVVEAADARR